MKGDVYIYMWMDGWIKRSADLYEKPYLQSKEQRQDPIIKPVYFAEVLLWSEIWQFLFHIPEI